MKKYTIKKYMGDDSLSWAIWDKAYPRPVMAGLSKKEASYYKRLLEKGDEERKIENVG